MGRAGRVTGRYHGAGHGVCRYEMQAGVRVHLIRNRDGLGGISLEFLKGTIDLVHGLRNTMWVIGVDTVHVMYDRAEGGVVSEGREEPVYQGGGGAWRGIRLRAIARGQAKGVECVPVGKR